MTAAVAVVVFGICAALPFYRSGGPGHSVLKQNERSDRGETAAREPASAEPRLRWVPGEKLVPPEPSPVMVLGGDAGAIGVSLDEVSPPARDTHARPPQSSSEPEGPPRTGRGRASSIRGDRPAPPVHPLEPYLRHTVRDGDSLEDLAVTYLGSAARANEIYELNRERPGCEHCREILPIGIELFIPRRDGL